jgi:hypothetical protein
LIEKERKSPVCAVVVPFDDVYFLWQQPDRCLFGSCLVDPNTRKVWIRMSYILSGFSPERF